MNFKWHTVSLVGIVLCSTCLHADVGVTNVVATPRWPWNGMVDIVYDVRARDPEANVRVCFSGVDLDQNNSVSMRTLSGEGASGSVKPGIRHVTWNAAADVQGMAVASFAVSVTVSPGERYLVIDLLGGATATHYPVAYLDAVPAGGWTEEYKTTKLVLRWISAGSFVMGSPTNELGRDSDEVQSQVVLTKDFYMGVFEVTQRQWELVTGNKPSYFNNPVYYATRPVEQVSYYEIREVPSNSAITPNWPSSSQSHAGSFIGKLREKTGLPEFDLPTEAQWEYACRAGTTTALNNGANLTSAERDANMTAVGRYWYNSGSGHNQGCATNMGTATVGTYLPNAWGLYDMHGNVWEWCLDGYGEYSDAMQDPVGAETGTLRVRRSGCWYYDAEYCRSAYRDYANPNYRNYGYGFRLARTVP